MLYSVPWFESLTPLLIPLGIVVAYLGVIVVFAEGLNRVASLNTELTRKVVHIGAGNVILLAWWLDIPLFVILGASAIAGLLAIISYFLPILPSINSVGRESLGTFFYAFSIGILSACFWYPSLYHYTVIGILVMAWGDGMAALIGQNFGKHKYSVFGMTKSWEGSLAMGIASFLVVSIVLISVTGEEWRSLAVAGVVAVSATGLEAFSKWGIDNLTVPLGSSAIAFLLDHLL